MAAKPTIDLMPVVAGLEPLDGEMARLEKLGYRIHGACGIPDRIFCTKTNCERERTFRLHFFPETSSQVTSHQAFRDYLRAHAGVARAYEQEKLRAAILHPENSMNYSQAKSAWVQTHEQIAMRWIAGKPACL